MVLRDEAYRRHSQKHYNKLLLAQDRMPNERIREPCQTPPSLLNETSIRR
jgi:hypothetical protein